MTKKELRNAPVAGTQQGSERISVPRAAARDAHTGRSVVLLREGVGRSGAVALRDATGLRIEVSSQLQAAGTQTRLAAGEGMYFERLGAALLHGDAEQIRALESCRAGHTLAVEPERYLRAGGLALDGSRTGTPASWGLEAIGILSCSYSGYGVRVAMLDTGLDLQHPDFAARPIVSRSFITGTPVEDRNGHGTHCAGVACGPLHPADVPRYGIASGADLYIAKVLDDNADGADGDVIAGIDWAIGNACAVICLSVGAPGIVEGTYSLVYERIAARALAAGSVLIAPAGNESQRPDTIAPVGHPANCPSILAIGAVDEHLSVAPFSNAGLSPGAGDIDLTAPGVAVLSAAPGSVRHQLGGGTSTAAAHVSGVAALLAEAHPRARGASLRALLLQTARPLRAPVQDVGAGLVQAPR
jgi:subtilisin family serine protease